MASQRGVSPGPMPPRLDPTACTRCGLCALACPCKAAAMGPEGPVFHCREACTHTNACVCVVHAIAPCAEVCPTGALSVAYEIAVVPTPADDLIEGAR